MLSTLSISKQKSTLLGLVATVKIIRNKQSGQPEGYGFIEFRSRAGAENALQTYNGTPMPSSEQNFRLNWATLGAGERRNDDTPDYTIFVGDLAADVSDYTLQELFKGTYPSCKGAKVVTDRTTGRSKGYGFVRFGDESEQMRAMTEMNGVVCSSRPMRIGPAATKSGTVGGMQKGMIYIALACYLLKPLEWIVFVSLNTRVLLDLLLFVSSCFQDRIGQVYVSVYYTPFH
ncbi:polyadenylate-binding protein RBP45 [Tanacetum coccineum]